MEQIEIEEQLSTTTTEDGKTTAEESSKSSNPPGIFTEEGITTLEEESFEHTIIKKSFLVGMGSLGKETEVVSMHQNLFGSLRNKTKLEAFRIYSRAMATKCGGNANIKHAWYGASKDEIAEIISHCFSRVKSSENCGNHGIAIHLYPAKFSIEGALSSVEDENGIRHILLCRVILGRTEEINGGSKQFHPSSKDFDSGVDNLLEPRRYILWSTSMNTRILPIHIISFRCPCLRDFGQIQGNISRVTFPWITFSTLLSRLERFLPPSRMNLIAICHSDFHKRKLTRLQLIQRVRQLAGDNLLTLAIKYL